MQLVFSVFIVLMSASKSIAQPSYRSDWSTSYICEHHQGKVEAIYRSMSEAVPHTDLFYPSCSRYIRDSMSKYGIWGLFSGFGRWAEAHVPKPWLGEVVINGEVRLYDPINAPTIFDHTTDITDWSGASSVQQSCGESNARVEKYIPFVGSLLESW